MWNFDDDDDYGKYFEMKMCGGWFFPNAVAWKYNRNIFWIKFRYLRLLGCVHVYLVWDALYSISSHLFRIELDFFWQNHSFFIILLSGIYIHIFCYSIVNIGVYFFELNYKFNSWKIILLLISSITSVFSIILWKECMVQMNVIKLTQTNDFFISTIPFLGLKKSSFVHDFFILMIFKIFLFKKCYQTRPI